MKNTYETIAEAFEKQHTRIFELEAKVNQLEQMINGNRAIGPLESPPAKEPECKHEWIWKGSVMTDNPETSYADYICSKCLKIDRVTSAPAEKEKSLARKLYEGRYFMTTESSEHLADIAEQHFKEKFDSLYGVLDCMKHDHSYVNFYDLKRKLFGSKE